jgi:hypothetical protein
MARLPLSRRSLQRPQAQGEHWHVDHEVLLVSKYVHTRGLSTRTWSLRSMMVCFRTMEPARVHTTSY